MISFADQFGELRPGAVWYATSEPKGYPSHLPCVLTPSEALTPGLVWDWRLVDFGAEPKKDLYNWVAVPEGGERRWGSINGTGSVYSINYPAHRENVDWFVSTREWGAVDGAHNPLAAMCNHKDTHSAERLPVPPASTAKEAPAGICAVAGFDHRPGAWK